MRFFLVCLFFGIPVASCARPDPQCQGQCDALTEACVVALGCAFMQNGNPNPFGEPDRYSCLALPQRCAEDRTCDCVLCSEDGANAGECFPPPAGPGCSDPVDDGPLLLVNACE